MSNYQTLTRWITYANNTQTVRLGVLPGPALVLNPFLIVQTGFNSDGTDLIRVGTASDDDAFGTDHNVASAIVPPTNFAAGTGLGYYPAGTQIIAKYLKSGSAPSAGAALVVVPYIRVPIL